MNTTAIDPPAAARALVPDLPGDAVAGVSPNGHPFATLVLSVDQVEHARRAAAGTPYQVTAPDQLDLLMALPVGERLAVDALSRVQQHVLRRLPRHAVRLEGPYGRPTHVTRLAVRPARVHLALVQGGTGPRALGAVTSYAPFCARALLLPGPPRKAFFLEEAAYWGVGVAVDHPGGDVEVLVAPEPWRPQRHTAAGWRFVEQAYQFTNLAVPTLER